MFCSPGYNREVFELLLFIGGPEDCMVGRVSLIAGARRIMVGRVSLGNRVFCEIVVCCWLED